MSCRGSAFRSFLLVAPMVILGLPYAQLPACSAQQAAPPSAAVPTTARAAIALIDLRELPKLNAERTYEDTATRTQYPSKSAVASAVAHYQAELKERGWTEARSLTGAPDTDQYADRVFSKDGYWLRLMIGESGPGESSISLVNLGNVDVSTLPKPSNPEILGELHPGNAGYLTRESVADAADRCSRDLTAAGWLPYKYPNSPSLDTEDSRQMSFVKNAVTLNVVIAKYPIPEKPGTLVAYSPMGVLPFDIPIDPTASGLEIDPSRPIVRFQSSLAPEKLAERLAARLDELGLKPSELIEAPEKLPAEYVVEGGQGLGYVLRLDANDDHATVVTMTQAPTVQARIATARPDAKQPDPNQRGQGEEGEHEADLATTIRQARELGLKEVRDALKDVPGGADIEKELGSLLKGIAGDEEMDDDDQPAPDKPEERADRVDASAFPLPDSARSIDLDSRRKQITFTSSEDADAQQEFFAARLEGIGWNQVSSSRSTVNNTKTFLVLGFFKDQLELRVEIDYDADKGTGKTAIKGSGLAFASLPGEEEPEPAAGALVAEELDGFLIPTENKGYSREGSKFLNRLETRVDATLDAVVAFYRNELANRGWKESSASSQVSKTGAVIPFTNDASRLLLTLTPKEDEIVIQLEARHPAAAREAGILPPEGRARLMLGNATAKNAVVTINGKAFEVAAGTASSDISKAMKLDLFPGTNKLVVKFPGTADHPEDLPVKAGEVWGFIILGDGVVFPVRLY